MPKQLTKKAVRFIERQNEKQLHFAEVLRLYTTRYENLAPYFKERPIEYYHGLLDGCQTAIEDILHMEGCYKGYQCKELEGYEIRSYYINTCLDIPNSQMVWDFVLKS